MEVGGQCHAPAALPPGKTWYPLYRRLGVPHSPSGRVRIISAPPGFDPWTIQPIASRYTDWAIPAHLVIVSLYTKMCKKYLDVANICMASTEFSSMGGTNRIVL